MHQPNLALPRWCSVYNSCSPGLCGFSTRLCKLCSSWSARQCTAEAANGSKQVSQGLYRACVEGVALVTSATTYLVQNVVTNLPSTELGHCPGLSTSEACCKETSGDSCGPTALHCCWSFHGQRSALEIRPSVSVQLGCRMTSLCRFTTRSATEVLRSLLKPSLLGSILVESVIMTLCYGLITVCDFLVCTSYVYVMFHVKRIETLYSALHQECDNNNNNNNNNKNSWDANWLPGT